jgi:membrane protein required for colicin V production
MNYIVDIVVIIPLVIFAFIGYQRGFLHEVVTVIEWTLGLLAAWHFGRYLEPQLGRLIHYPLVREWSARVIVFLIMMFVIAAVGKAVLKTVHLALDKNVDKGLGVTFGAVRGLMVLGVLVLLGQLLRLDGAGWWRHSALMPYGESAANGVRLLVGESEHRKPMA